MSTELQTNPDAPGLAPEYLRTVDASLVSGIPPATLQTWISRPPKHGAPPSIKVGGIRLYPRRAFLAWLESFATSQNAAG